LTRTEAKSRTVYNSNRVNLMMTSQATHKLRRVNCLNVAEHVQQELDQRLSAKTFRTIKAHLQRCPNCTAYLESLKKTILLYKRVPSARISKTAKEKIFAMLQLGMKIR
jgi:hypothetical protein